MFMLIKDGLLDGDSCQKYLICLYFLIPYFIIFL